MSKLFTYDENSMGHITLYSPDGDDIYLQYDYDIESFNDSIKAIEEQWGSDGRITPHPGGFETQEEEESDMISNYF